MSLLLLSFLTQKIMQVPQPQLYFWTLALQDTKGIKGKKIQNKTNQLKKRIEKTNKRNKQK